MHMEEEAPVQKSLSEQLEEANTAIGRAIAHFIDLTAQKEELENPFMMSWVAYSEFLVKDDLDSASSKGVLIHPKDQLPSTTRGLFSFGADRYTTAKLNPQA